MVRPLGLPVGSIRALLLLSLAVTAVFDLRYDHRVAPYLIVAILLTAGSYFAARSLATEGGQRQSRAPLGLPAGTVRLLFVVLVGYGVWLWFQHNDASFDAVPTAWVLAAYVVGLFVRAIVRSKTHGEQGATLFEHILALVTLIAAAGLVWMSADAAATPPRWVEPLLTSIVVHYFATR